MLNSKISSITAFAPATCANVAVGFDILGFAMDAAGDTVTLTKRDDTQVVIEKIISTEKLPTDPNKNTATVVIQKLLEDLNIKCGFSMVIQKGIPVGSGMGGSAASAVAALVACNAFLKKPLPLEKLVYYALFGEEAACGQKHPDNIVPCFYGGVTLIASTDPVHVVQIPAPDLFCTLVHPHLVVETKHARSILKPELTLANHVKQSASLATFIAALHQKNSAWIKNFTQDFLIEPQRSVLVPGFYEVKKAALDAGALLSSFSGSGPSLFALSETRQSAATIAKAMTDCFAKNNIQSDSWISPIQSKGAHVI